MTAPNRRSISAAPTRSATAVASPGVFELAQQTIPTFVEHFRRVCTRASPHGAGAAGRGVPDGVSRGVLELAAPRRNSLILLLYFWDNVQWLGD